MGAVSRFIEPGSPWHQENRLKRFLCNGFIESFHGRLRDELLNRETFVSLAEARVLLEQHRLWYNRERPHSSLGYASPDEFHGTWQKKHEEGTQQKKN